MDLSALFSNPIDKWLPQAGTEPANLARMRLANMYGQRSQGQRNQSQTSAPAPGARTAYFGPPPSAVDSLVRNRAESAALKELDTQRSTEASTMSPTGGAFDGPGQSFVPGQNFTPGQTFLNRGMAQAKINPQQYARAIMAKGNQMRDDEDPRADSFNFSTPNPQ